MAIVGVSDVRAVMMKLLGTWRQSTDATDGWLSVNCGCTRDVVPLTYAAGIMIHSTNLDFGHETAVERAQGRHAED
ncbi:hypothetical protein GCM10023350_00160 [Nocardioides endophyticus]|uniref:Uncharacterized protein n=1 Tax=Nocardioides endophyticus TaxID=1353775 RepID=A0ABP8Y585_9ACTN